MTTDAPPRPRPADPDATKPLAIDPRLRARRIAVRRQEGRRRLTTALVALGLAVVAAVAWLVVFESPLLSVATIEVNGAAFTDPGAIRDAATPVRGDAMLTADLGAVRRQVAALPWVASVRVSRRWPRTVRIDVVERRPAAALLQGDGTWRLVDLDGRVLAASPNQPAGVVPVVAGGAVVAPGATVDGWRAHAVTVAGRLAPSLTARLADVHLDPEGGVVVGLQGGGAVWLGNSDHLATKQVDALSVLAAVGSEPVGVIDVRVPGSPVHRPPEPAQTSPDALTGATDDGRT